MQILVEVGSCFHFVIHDSLFMSTIPTPARGKSSIYIVLYYTRSVVLFLYFFDLSLFLPHLSKLSPLPNSPYNSMTLTLVSKRLFSVKRVHLEVLFSYS